jgi:ADP-ribose pyrophosphatase
LATFRKLGERPVWQGSLVSAAVATFRAPDGSTFERDVVHHPGAVSVVPLLGDGSVLLVRQYRAAIDAELLEIPAGKRDVAGEAPEVTASRELVEEVGMRAGRLDRLAEFYNSPGFCDEHAWVFLGRDLEPCANSLQGVEEQHMTVERVRLDDTPELVATGAILDAKTIIGLTLARFAVA